MEEEHRRHLWALYGWFSGLMCVGSVFGAVAWAAWMQFLVALYSTYTTSPTPPMSQLQSFNAQSDYWAAAFYVPYAIEFLCLSAAKLLVLHRMAEFSVAKGDGMRMRLAVGGRVVMAAVVVGNVVGLCGNVTAAVYSKKAGDAFSDSAAAYATNSTNAAVNFNNQANQMVSNLDVATSVQYFCEVVVLLVIILAFAVVGIASARLLSSALRHVTQQHGPAGRQLQRQILGTTSFVFVTFLLRAVFSSMNALGNSLQNGGAACAAADLNPCDATCFNLWWLMLQWMTLTPEFQLIVVLISSPLALLVALWGMTSERTLQHMSSSRGQTVALPLRTQ